MTTQLLLVSGSLRAASTNTALLRTAVELAPSGTTARLYEGLGRLPHYNPDDDTGDDTGDDAEPLDPSVVDLRAAVGRADAVVFSTPEYAGALPGSFKNLLDWLVGATETAGKPVAWINASSSPRRAADAHASLRTVLAWIDTQVVDAACAHIPVPRQALGDDGCVTDPATRSALAATLATLVDHLTPTTGN